MRALVLAAALLAALAAPAQADIFGTFEAATEAGDFDIVKFNASTGARSSLPATVNTPAHEYHPSLSPDGRRLVFSRVDPAAGTTRIVMVDLTTGQSADLFSAFEIPPGDPPLTPFFNADGTQVLTGRSHLQTPSQGLRPAVTQTDVTAFPGGPFPKSQTQITGPAGTAASRTRHVQFHPGTLKTYGITGSGLASQVLTAGSVTGIPDTAHPAASAEAGVVVFENRRGGVKLEFRSLSAPGAASTPLPAVVNNKGAITHPRFSRDGRYLGFMGTSADVGSRPELYVWDTQTQLLVNPDGVGPSTGSTAISLQTLAREEGAVAIEVVRVFAKTTVVGDQVGFTVTSPTRGGILVQRIVGRHRVLGRSAPKLKLVGRVPLGKFAKGGGKARWGYEVDGRRVEPGRYLVTPRAVTAAAEVLDLGRPTVVRVPKPR